MGYHQPDPDWTYLGDQPEEFEEDGLYVPDVEEC